MPAQLMSRARAAVTHCRRCCSTLVNQGASTTAAAAGSAALALIGLPGMMLAAAASYAGSLLFQRGIRINPARPAPRKGAGGQFRHGFTTLPRRPVQPRHRPAQ
jgi:hypothetical protein